MIDLAIANGIATVTMARPPVNAIDEELLAAFHAVLDRLEADGSVQIMVLRSARKVFCAGANIARIGEMFAEADGPEAMVEFVRGFHTLFNRIERLPLVTLAVIQGAAMGGGLEMALACDLRLASETALLGLPEAKIGMIPAAGGTQRLTRLCGAGLASRIILGAEAITGAEAARYGLVQWAASAATLEATLAEITERIAGLSRASLVAAKDCIAAQRDPAIDGFARELEKPLTLMRDADSQARIQAFLTR